MIDWSERHFPLIASLSLGTSPRGEKIRRTP
jgi:hypothetical protein